MKKLILLLIVVLSTMSCELTIQHDTDAYFVDETFTITDATEQAVLINGETKNVRVWKIQRDKVVNDTIYNGVISDKGYGFIITDELWYLKTVGDRLYFDFILRKRFAPTVRIKTTVASEIEPVVTTPETRATDFQPGVFHTPTFINMNTLEIERRMMAIEREILTLQREYETLSSNVN